MYATISFCCLRSEHVFNNNIKLLQTIYIYIIAIESITFVNKLYMFTKINNIINFLFQKKY